MFNIIRSEIYRLIHSKCLWVCVAFLIFSGTMGVGTYEYTRDMFRDLYNNSDAEMQAQLAGEDDAMVGMQIGSSVDIFGFADDPDTNSALTLCLSDNTIQYLLAILIAIFIAGDYSKGTIKHPVTMAVGRCSVYFAKLISMCIAGLFLIFVFYVYTFILGGILWKFKMPNSEQLQAFLSSFGITLLVMFAFISLFTMVSLLLKNTGGAVAVTLCILIFMPLLLSFATNMLDLAFTLDDSFTLNDYWLSNMITGILNKVNDSKLIIKAVVTSVIYIIASTSIGCFVMSKQDIK